MIAGTLAAPLLVATVLAQDSAVCDSGQSPVIETAAGSGERGYGGDGVTATAALINQPSGVVSDAAGNIYIADNGNHRVRRIDPSGTITTVAGTGQNGFTSVVDGGRAIEARLSQSDGVAVILAFPDRFGDSGHASRRAPNALAASRWRACKHRYKSRQGQERNRCMHRGVFTPCVSPSERA